jgi:hypothetical protein
MLSPTRRDEEIFFRVALMMLGSTGTGLISGEIRRFVTRRRV